MRGAALRRLLSCAVLLSAAAVVAQDGVSHPSAIDVDRVYDSLKQDAANGVELRPLWWQPYVLKPVRKTDSLPTDIHTLIFLAIRHSHNIQIAKQDPLIRETAIDEAVANFDWVRYFDTAWNDSSDPIGNQLTAGGTSTRFEEQTAQFRAGVRKTTTKGGRLDISQRFGWQDNNSVFFTPSDQATGRLAVSFTQPLMRGRGRAYNTSLEILARLNANAAYQEFLASLQDELLDITDLYWKLYLARTTLFNMSASTCRRRRSVSF